AGASSRAVWRQPEGAAEHGDRGSARCCGTGAPSSQAVVVPRHSPPSSVPLGPVRDTIGYRCANGTAENITDPERPQLPEHRQQGVVTTGLAGRIDCRRLFACPPVTTAATRSQYSCRRSVTVSKSPFSLRCRVLKFEDNTDLRQPTCHLAVAADTTKGAI